MKKSYLNSETKFILDSLENTAVLTTKNVINNKMLITRVYHNTDGSWQFLDDLSTNANENIMVVGFGQVVKRDSSIIKLVNMENSYFAHRKTQSDDWKIGPFEETEE